MILSTAWGWDKANGRPYRTETPAREPADFRWHQNTESVSPIEHPAAGAHGLGMSVPA
jgi:hypothetical protein